MIIAKMQNPVIFDSLNKPPFHADRRTSGKVQREAKDLTSEAKGGGKEASKAKGV